MLHNCSSLKELMCVYGGRGGVQGRGSGNGEGRTRTGKDQVEWRRGEEQGMLGGGVNRKHHDGWRVEGRNKDGAEEGGLRGGGT